MNEVDPREIIEMTVFTGDEKAGWYNGRGPTGFTAVSLNIPGAIPPIWVYL
jgi:hypothetical protein